MKNYYTIILCGMLLCIGACKEPIKKSEVEVRKEISEKLEDAGLYKESSNSDEIIAAMNVVFKSSYESLGDDNHKLLKSWSKSMNYDGAEELYDDMFASFNMSEQVASLIEEYTENKFASSYERDVFNQSVAMLFSKENDPEAFKSTQSLFNNVYRVTSKSLQANNVKVDPTIWNKGMKKNFTQYWYVHANTILKAIGQTEGTTLNEFLKRKPS